MTKSSEVESFTVHEAKTHLSRILRMVESGAEVQIRRGSSPIAKIVPLEDARPVRRLGSLKDEIWISDDFDEPMKDLEEAIENSEIFPA